MVSPSIFLTQSITIINCFTSWATFHSWAIKISSCFSGWSGFGFHTKITNCGQCLITDNIYKGFTSKDFLAYLVNHIEKSSRRKKFLWNYWTEQCRTQERQATTDWIPNNAVCLLPCPFTVLSATQWVEIWKKLQCRESMSIFDSKVKKLWKLWFFPLKSTVFCIQDNVISLCSITRILLLVLNSP